MLNFDAIKVSLSKKSQGHESEVKHIVDFLLDIVDNVKYDVKTGSYAGVEKQALKQQLLGSIDELRASCDILEREVKKVLK